MQENKENSSLLSLKKRKFPSYKEEEKGSPQKKAFRDTRKPLASVQSACLPCPESPLLSPFKTPPSSPVKATVTPETPERRVWEPFKRELIEAGVLSQGAKRKSW